jgi:hypothetical protein
MTIVAGLNINGYPVLIADLLISAEGNHATEIPTIKNMTEVGYYGIVPVDLNQKIAIVSDNLMIAWAGSRIAAKTVIKEMLERNKSQMFTKDSLIKYLKTLGESIGQQDVRFLGFLIEEGRVYPFGFRYNIVRTEKLGDIGLLGTGSEDLMEILKQVLQNQTFTNIKENEFVGAIAFTLLLSGTLLMYEVATAQTLIQRYGGGYEIASVMNGRFQKLEDITYLFWSAWLEGKTVHINPFPYNVLKNVYFNDILVVLGIILEETAGDGCLVKKQTTDIIPPIYRNINRDEIKSLSFPSINSTWLCNYFYVKTPEGKFETFAKVDHRMDDSLIRFEEDGQEIKGIGVEKRFIEEVAQEIVDRFIK